MNNNGQIGIGTGNTSEILTLSGNVKLTNSGWIGNTTNQLYLGKNGKIGLGTNTLSTLYLVTI